MTAKSILLIDDMPEDRDMITRLIASSDKDWMVQSAETGAEGITSFQTAPPDCVLLDNRLEAEDGLDVLLELKELADSAR